MRYELADYEWVAIRPMLPDKPPGVPRVNDVVCPMTSSGSCDPGGPWRDLPEAPDTYNWSQLLVRVLQQCGDDLSRENVMRQATNIRNFIPTMLLPGLSINIGPKDYAPIKQVQLTKFEGERWMPLGAPVEGN